MPSEVRFTIVRKRLEQHGWWLERVIGSYHIFKHETQPTISIPVHRGKVKPIYARQVDKAIEEAQRHAQDEG